MSFLLYPAANRTTVNWASGTSTELFIYPTDGSFAKRDFLFRISTATVEAEESTFTFFEGITRHLMILKGELDLVHEGRYSKHLKPFEQDTFSGEWPTTSKGKVTDFNLMLKQGATGTLAYKQLQPGTRASFCGQTSYNFLYVAKGQARLGTNQLANAGDLLQIPEGTEVTLQAAEQCDVIEIKISFS